MATKKKAATKKTATTKQQAQTKASATKKAPAIKKLSQLNAAVKVLGEANEPMTTKAMIEAMAAKKYWTSPGGKTPAQTLYSSITREIKTKGSDSRFAKVDKGQFALNE